MDEFSAIMFDMDKQFTSYEQIETTMEMFCDRGICKTDIVTVEAIHGQCVTDLIPLGAFTTHTSFSGLDVAMEGLSEKLMKVATAIWKLLVKVFKIARKMVAKLFSTLSGLANDIANSAIEEGNIEEYYFKLNQFIKDKFQEALASDINMWAELKTLVVTHEEISKINDDFSQELYVYSKDSLKVINVYNFGESVNDFTDEQLKSLGEHKRVFFNKIEGVGELDNVLAKLGGDKFVRGVRQLSDTPNNTPQLRIAGRLVDIITLLKSKKKSKDIDGDIQIEYVKNEKELEQMTGVILGNSRYDSAFIKNVEGISDNSAKILKAISDERRDMSIRKESLNYSAISKYYSEMARKLMSNVDAQVKITNLAYRYIEDIDGIIRIAKRFHPELNRIK